MPAKPLAPRPERPPSDQEVIDAINDHQAKAEASRQAYDEMMEARERLVDVLRRRGVLGFTSL
jgi:hypothetical protein